MADETAIESRTMFVDLDNESRDTRRARYESFGAVDLRTMCLDRDLTIASWRDAHANDLRDVVAVKDAEIAALNVEHAAMVERIREQHAIDVRNLRARLIDPDELVAKIVSYEAGCMAGKRDFVVNHLGLDWPTQETDISVTITYTTTVEHDYDPDGDDDLSDAVDAYEIERTVDRALGVSCSVEWGVA